MARDGPPGAQGPKVKYFTYQEPGPARGRPQGAQVPKVKYFTF
jgi:hypothetical protein